MSAEPIREATDAELDAKMLRELRDYHTEPGGIFLTHGELDLLLRIADERDALKRELCDEREGRGRRPVDEKATIANTHVITRCAFCPHAPHGAGFLCHSDNRCGCRGGIS